MTGFQKRYWNRDSLSDRRSPKHPVIKAYAESRIKSISKFIKIDKKTKIIDVGAGNGFFSYQFDKISDITAIDYSKKMVELNPVKKKKMMDANHLEFEDNSFDISFCHALLHHVNSEKKVISEMKRVSKKYVVIIEPNRNNPLVLLFSALLAQERKAVKYSLQYMKNLVSSQDLKLVAAYSYGFTVPNKTPKFLLPLTTQFDVPFFMGVTNIIICEK